MVERFWVRAGIFLFREWKARLGLMTDDAARKILQEAVEAFVDEGKKRGDAPTVFSDPLDGETCIEYKGEVPGYGYVRCVYKPLSAVRTTISDCERLFERAGVKSEFSIEDMALIGAVTLLTGFVSGLGHALKETSESSLFIVEAATYSALSTDRRLRNARDLREAIDSFSMKVSQRRKVELQRILRDLPGIISMVPRGRQVGSKMDRSLIRSRREKRKAMLIDAVISRYDDTGMEEYSIKEIAKEANVSAKTATSWMKDADWDLDELVAAAFESKKN
jgi:hypothetical protein